MSHPSESLRLAKRGPLLSIVAYIILTAGKLTYGYWLNSSALIADGFNNLSDIVGNIALLVGLHLASQPADEDHRFGHWKIEDLSSLITSFIMFLVGFQVMIQTIQKIFSGKETSIDPTGAVVGVISALVMLGVYAYNKSLSKKVKSSALVAAAKDNLSDALTSLGASIAIVTSSLNFPMIDHLVALVIALFILKTAYDIFMETTFSLSDGFDQAQLKAYEAAILEIPQIIAVKSQRGRTYGSNIYLDIILEMNPNLSVYDSHAITEQVEQLLSKRFAIYDIDIHVEPAAISKGDRENLITTLYQNEMAILSQKPHFKQYLSDAFVMIEADDEIVTKEQISTSKTSQPAPLMDFQTQPINQETQVLTYRLGQYKHMSLWQRSDTWHLLYHHISNIEPHQPNHED